MSKKFEIKDNDISDGYHTFDELYEHRCLLFLSLCLSNPSKATWKPHYEGWFALYLETPFGQISYHLPEKLREVTSKYIRQENTEWDGHTSNDVLDRLMKTITLGLKD